MAWWAESETRRPGEARRRADRRRADLQRDHLVLLEHYRCRVPGKDFRPAAAGHDENRESLSGGHRQRPHVSAVEILMPATPCRPYPEEVTERELAVVRRLDVDDAGLAAVHVEPVVAKVLTADARRYGDRLALVEDLDRGVIVNLRVLEP